MRCSTLILGAACLSGVLALPLLRAEEASPARAAFESIRKQDLMRHVEYLASDELEGRAAGSKGCYKAGDYIARHFKEYGLKPGGEQGTYFQNVPMGQVAGLGHNNRLAWRKGERGSTAAVGREFTPFPFSAKGKVAAEVVFAGYGITAPEEKYDDYAGLDVKGKVVLIYRHEPREQGAGAEFSGKRNTRHAYFTTKVKNAQDRGAAALLVVDDPANHKDGPLFGFRGQGDRTVTIPVLHVKQSIARALFELAGKDLLAVQQEIDKALAPRSFATGVTVELAAELKIDKLAGRNVLGLLEGTDPRMKHEIVVIGGHYDHLGYGHYGSLGGPAARNQIHNGADDNASGTAAVIEIAEAFFRAGVRPRRSILFMGFTGEERGLVGSRHYCEHPIHPLKDTVAMINLDMVGRGETGKFQVSGIGTSPAWPGLVRAINERLGTQVSFGQSGYAPSDNTSFYQKNIPVLFFFTGMHPNYHRPSDDTHRINREQIEVVSRYAFTTLYYLANVLDERPAFTRSGGRPRPGGRGGAFLGVGAGEESDQGFRVGSVTPGTAAAKAGLQAGDIITHFDGKPVAGMRALVRAIGAHKPGDEVTIVYLRGDQSHTVKVKLGRR